MLTTHDIQATIVAALVVLCCSTAPAAANVNMSSLCLLVTPGTLVGDPNGCSTYYSCAGAVATLQTCASGLNFDKNQGACVSGWVATCPNTVNSQPCLNKPIGSWQPASSCGGYYYCAQTGPMYGSCPSGQNFYPAEQRCVYSSEYLCSTSGTADSTDDDSSLSLCNIIPNNMYFGNPDDCNSWYYCADGGLKYGSCPVNSFFNVQQQMCNYVPTCVQVTNDPSLPGVSLSGQSCTTSQAQATSCNQYYQCSASNIYQLQTCESGLFYDTKNHDCVLPLQAVNKCNRCAGSSSRFVNACEPNDCSQYLACSDGVEQYQEACPVGYYFDNSLGGCTITNPNYPCCSGDPTTNANATTSAGGSTTANSDAAAATTKSDAAAATTKSDAAAATTKSDAAAATTTSDAATTTK